MRKLLVDAGFREVSIAVVRQLLRFTSPREYVRLQVGATPMASLLEGMAEEEKASRIDAITASLAQALERGPNGRALQSLQEAFVVNARR